MPLTRLVLGGPVIDGFEGLPSTWIATQSLGFNRPTKPGDPSQVLPVLGSQPARSDSTSSLKVNRAGNEHPTRSTLVSRPAARIGAQVPFRTAKTVHQTKRRYQQVRE